MYRVLIVDDEYPARELLKTAVDWEKAGVSEILEADNGEKALEIYHKYKPELIITDIQMPVMNGLELIRRIKEEDSRQHFVILSCHESFSYAKTAIRLGVRDYLLKDSYTEEELYTLLWGFQEEQKKWEQREQEKEGIPPSETLHAVLRGGERGQSVMGKGQELLSGYSGL